MDDPAGVVAGRYDQAVAELGVADEPRVVAWQLAA